MFPLLDQAGAEVLAYIKYDFPQAWKGELRIKFHDYSASRECFVQPNIVEYDGTTMSLPGFDLILGTNTLKELGIVLNF